MFCLVAMFFGVWCAISIFPTCIVAGIWQIAAGFAMIVIEVSHPHILVVEVSHVHILVVEVSHPKILLVEVRDARILVKEAIDPQIVVVEVSYP
jgi:hypothetical protein